MKRLFIAILFFFVAFQSFALTWDDSDTGFLDVKNLQALAAETTAQKYPDADTVILDTETRIKYEADGTSVQVADNAVKILTLKGVDEERVLQSYYSLSYSRAKISLVQILKDNGDVITLDLKTCTQEMVEDSQMSSNIFDPNHRVIKVTVANLQPGDTLRAVYVDELNKPRVPNSYSDIEILEGTDPILHTKVLIDAPKALPLRSIVVKDPQNGGPKHSKKAEGDRILYSWEVKDVPQVFPEPSSPKLIAYLQRVVVSTFASWEEVSRWYSQLCEPRLTLNDDIRKGVELLTAQCQSDDEKILALYNFVSQKVRYMGLTLEDTAPGYEPHDVSLTYQQRAGVCRDMAALLVAMLRAAGYDAHPTLIHVGPTKDIEVPQPYFNHAITAVRDPATGDWRLMDPTNTNTREPFPAYLSDKSYLVATAEGDPLRVSPVRPYQENLLTIHSTGKLQETSDLTLNTELTFNGISDNAYRNFFLNSTPEQHRLFFEHQLATAIPGAILTRLEITPKDLQDLTEPLRAYLAYQVPAALITAQKADGSPDLTPGKHAMLRFPRLSGAFGLNLMVFGSATLEKRRFPLEAGSTRGVIEDLEIDLPENLSLVGAPKYSQIDNKDFAITRSFEKKPGKLFVHALYASKVMRYSPEAYLQLKKALAQKEADDKKMAIFRVNEPLPQASIEKDTQADKPDLEYEDYRTIITVHSPTSWTIERDVKFQVKTYAGIEYADFSFDFNPAWEELEILSAKVTTNGVTQETPKENINIMDAPWAASAPRYPAGKILVLNLPGVEVGSVVELQYQRTCRNRPFFYYAETIRKSNPIKHWSLAILAKGEDMSLARNFYKGGWLNLPDDLENPIYVRQDVNKYPDGTYIYSYDATDVPATHKEMNLPPDHAYLPTVVFSSGNWFTYANTLRNYVKALGDGDYTIKNLVEPMRVLEPEACIVEIRDWIEKNIRDTSPAFCALPLSCLTPPEVTAKAGYGNSADKAILYHAMLNAAGIPSQIFLASSTPQMRELKQFRQKHPADAFFQEWLVLVNLNGKEIWLNDQTQYGQFGTCVFDHGLLLDLNNGTIANLELPENYKDLQNSQWSLTVRDDGSALLAVKESISGDSFGSLKRFYDRLTPEERRRHYQKLVSGISQDAVPITPDIHTDFHTYPGTVSYEILLKNCATQDGDFCYLRLPLSLADAIGYARAKRQFHPLYHGNFQQGVTTLEVTLPATFPNIVLAPNDYRWVAPDNAGVISWQCKDLSTPFGASKKLRFTLSVDLQPGITPVRLYDQYQEAYRYLKHPAATTLLLSK